MAYVARDPRGGGVVRPEAVYMDRRDVDGDPVVRDDVVDNGCAIHAIAFGPSANETLLQSIAGDPDLPGGSFGYAETEGELPVNAGGAVDYEDVTPDTYIAQQPISVNLWGNYCGATASGRSRAVVAVPAAAHHPLRGRR